MADVKVDPRDCTVCFKRYDDDGHRPRVLTSCGHSFCSTCITEMIKDNKLQCPNCRASCDLSTVDQLPVNFALLDIVLGDFVSPEDSSSSVSDTQEKMSPKVNGGLCEDHCQYKLFRCTTCDLFICHLCTITEHPSASCSIVSIKQAIEEMKADELGVANSELVSCEEVTEHLVIYEEHLDKQLECHEDQINMLKASIERHNDLIKKLGEERSRVQEALVESSKMQDMVKTSEDDLSSITSLQEVQDAVIQTKNSNKTAKTWRIQCVSEFPDIETLSLSLKLQEATGVALKALKQKDSGTTTAKAVATTDLLSIVEKIDKLKQEMKKPLKSSSKNDIVLANTSDRALQSKLSTTVKKSTDPQSSSNYIKSSQGFYEQTPRFVFEPQKPTAKILL